MSYAAWKLLHVAAIILFVGNITTGVFWAAHAHRSRDWRLIASTFKGITRSDRWFTIPGVIGIVVGGVAAARRLDAHARSRKLRLLGLQRPIPRP